MRQSHGRRIEQRLWPHGTKSHLILISLSLSVFLLLLQIVSGEASAVGLEGLIALELSELTEHAPHKASIMAVNNKFEECAPFSSFTMRESDELTAVLHPASA
jgi:hypothetical protein